MNIEVIEFYPLEINEAKGFLNGTIRIRLCDLKIEVLGVYISKKNNSWFYSLPSKIGVTKNGEKIKYPVISFDADMEKQLMASIKEKAPLFIEKRMADNENPLAIPPKQHQPQRQASITRDCSNAADAKRVASNSKPKVPVTNKPSGLSGLLNVKDYSPAKNKFQK